MEPEQTDPPPLHRHPLSDEKDKQPSKRSHAMPVKPTFKENPITDSPMSTPSDSPFGQLSPSATDRVFPVRSVISVDSNLVTPIPRSELRGRDGFPELSESANTVGSAIGESGSAPSETSSRARYGGWRHSIPGQPATRSSFYAADSRQRTGDVGRMWTDAGRSSTKSESVRSGVGDAAASTSESMANLTEDPEPLLTARFKHIMTDGGHAVIIGRDQENLQRCEDEPIHIPGAIQTFGLLVALQEEDIGKLKVRIVSENSQRLIGHTPKQLFALESFCDIMSEEQTDILLDHLDFIRDDGVDPATNGPEVFTITIRSPTRRLQKMWCAMHINHNNSDLIICEFELEDDRLNPLVPAGEATPEPPGDTLQSNPTAEELAESTVIASKPLRVLRSARKRRGEAAAMEVFNIMSQVQEQLATAPNLEVFLKVLVGVIKELTGFHRVMIYQFDQAWNGHVVTELVDPNATKDLYKGLHFPASDIPKQARDLYKLNKVRLLYDRDQETARLVCRTIEDLDTPLDLTFSYLRAMSPIHLKYLANMSVRASMSVSINAFNELWGLIACHSYGSKGMRVSFPIRKMCRLVGDSASQNIERLSYASRLQARKLINTVPMQSKPTGYIIASSDDLLTLFNADCGLLSIKDETKILGKIDQTQEALAMLEYLRLRKITSVLTCTDIQTEFPDFRYDPGFTIIAGLLLVPLSVGGNDFIVFFRKGQTHEVKWAGNPYEKVIREGTYAYLEPRKSFKTWSETVVGKSKEWTEEEIETAAVLCLVYGKFIEVWRQKEAVLQNSQLTRLLLANSAHEVRTPLNAIINYLEIALEGAIDQETRDNLSKSHSASKSLIYVINDLLDLTKTEEGHNLINYEVFDLPATVREAANMFIGDAKRKNIDYDVVEHPGVPQFVIGDQRRVRQAISNVTANAIKHTSTGGVKVELWLAARVGNQVEVDIVIQDTGVGMSAEQVDCLFRDMEQVQSGDEDEEQQSIVQRSETAENEPKTKTLGLGLALVARLIRTMNGQLRLKSEAGRGSRFVIQLGFDLPENDQSQVPLKNVAISGMSPADQPSTPPIEIGEVTLINKSAQKATPSAPMKDISPRRSTESLKSFKSVSSMKSDVDRLIDAFQAPHMLPNSPTKPEISTSRPGSRLGQRPEPKSKISATPLKAGSLNLTTFPDPNPSGPGESFVDEFPKPTRSIPTLADTAPDSSLVGLLARTPARVLFDTSDKPVEPLRMLTGEDLHVLVAEDDPINSRIIKKRLEKIGHSVHLTVNGEECSSTYGENPGSFDVVLMDMQMPIVDGLTSTKMIRSFEKSTPRLRLSDRAALNGRVPVFAVSASLVEGDRQLYIDAGFDGWILKPINFQRLTTLLSGIVEKDTRERCIYESGEWERGGWFAPHQAHNSTSTTLKSSAGKVSTIPGSKPAPPENAPTSTMQDCSGYVKTDAPRPKPLYADIGPSEDPG